MVRVTMRLSHQSLIARVLLATFQNSIYYGTLHLHQVKLLSKVARNRQLPNMASTPANEPSSLVSQVAGVLRRKQSSNEERLAALSVSSGILSKSQSNAAMNVSLSDNLRLLNACLGGESAMQRSFVRRLLVSESHPEVSFNVVHYALELLLRHDDSRNGLKADDLLGGDEDELRKLREAVLKLVTTLAKLASTKAAQIFPLLGRIVQLGSFGLVAVAGDAAVIRAVCETHESTGPEQLESFLAFIRTLMHSLHSALNEAVSASLVASEPPNPYVLTAHQLSQLQEPMDILLTHLSSLFAGRSTRIVGKEAMWMQLQTLDVFVGSGTHGLRVFAMELPFTLHQYHSDVHMNISKLSLDPSTPQNWGEAVFDGLGSLLQNKLDSKSRGLALMLASETLALLGPSWLFGSEVSNSSSADSRMKRSQFIALLIHLVCTDLRVLLDSLEPEMEPATGILLLKTATLPSFKEDTNDPTSTPDPTIAAAPDPTQLLTSHTTFLTHALHTLASTADTHSSHALPADLTISLHRALAEALVSLLAHLVDCFEAHRASPSQTTRFTDSSRTIRTGLRAVCTWLGEDSAAQGVREVWDGAVEMLVHVVREEGFSEWGGVWMDLCAREPEGEEGEALERFLACGGGAVVVEAVLFGDVEGGERDVGVTCLLNLVVGGGAGVLGRCLVGPGVEGYGDARDVLQEVLKGLLRRDLTGSVGPETAIHVMNACCLALFLLKDTVKDLPVSLSQNLMAASLRVLLPVRAFCESNVSVWEEVSELWYLSVTGLAALVRNKATAAFVGNVTEFGMLVEYCQQNKDGSEVVYEEGPALHMFKTVFDTLNE
ncbi:hypothetical protein BC830DRAFT_1218999 [Chytriomyces sp. MP71]|nr:hypothetical protein BC830DRAFT_1218999 [Chytriomyces sp. MP71]